MKTHLSVLESGVDEPLLVTVLDAPTSRAERETVQESAKGVLHIASGLEAKKGRTNRLTVMFLEDMIEPERARVLLSSVMQPPLKVAQPVGRVTFDASDGFCQTVSRLDPPQFSVASPELGRRCAGQSGRRRSDEKCVHAPGHGTLF